MRPLLVPFLSLILGLAALPAAADMRQALALAAGQDWQAARAAAPDGVGRDVIAWQALRAGDGTLTEYEDFLSRRADWPGLPLLREKGEVAVTRSGDPDRVIAWFAPQPPRTGAGAIALVTALKAAGRAAEAETEAMRAWAELSLTADQEAALLALEAEAIAVVHDLRLENALWDGRLAEAERMLPRVSEGRGRLVAARIALQRDRPGTTALIDAVPAALRDDPGLAWDRFAWRMKRELYAEAADFLLAVPPDRLGRPEVWADRRALLVRWLLRQDRPRDAYALASRHGLTEGAGYADLEFLSGFVALRRLGDPALAARHFGHLREGVSTPISLARASYWLGRAAEAQGADAAAHYRDAARHQTAYYGLLAAERLGLSLDAGLLDSRLPGGWQGAPFAATSGFQVVRLLLEAGDRQLAKRFFLHLAEGRPAGELGQMAAYALDAGEPHLAVVLGKAAAERGIILPGAYFPVPDFIPDGLAVSRALALAIARRESEFDPQARSGANAQGLMQVLPGTAELTAPKIGLAHGPGKLLSDPVYNVQVGAAYLAQMVAEFGPSIALVASGYNAGPGRPRRWMTEFGDPRLPGTDIVDWVETIPFAETRTYVMRVVEGVVIYRAKLKGEAGPVRISAELRG